MFNHYQEKSYVCVHYKMFMKNGIGAGLMEAYLVNSLGLDNSICYIYVSVCAHYSLS